MAALVPTEALALKGTWALKGTGSTNQAASAHDTMTGSPPHCLLLRVRRWLVPEGKHCFVFRSVQK